MERVSEKFFCGVWRCGKRLFWREKRKGKRGRSEAGPKNTSQEECHSNIVRSNQGLQYIQFNSSIYSQIYLTAPSAFSLSSSLSLNPKLSLKISSVCCPNIGGTLRILGLLSLYFTGVLTILIGPHHSCSISFTMSLARTCSWFNVPWISFTAEYGRPEPSKTSSHSCVVFVCVMASIKLSSSTRFATRDLLIANLGSAFHSGCWRRSQMMPKRRSLPPPNRMSPSCVLYARYGTIDASIR